MIEGENKLLVDISKTCRYIDGDDKFISRAIDETNNPGSQQTTGVWITKYSAVVLL
jgi:hypothetical protein